jgi:hypothetical protein
MILALFLPGGNRARFRKNKCISRFEKVIMKIVVSEPIFLPEENRKKLELW